MSRWQRLNNCKIPIKCFDVILCLIKSISVENFNDLMRRQSSSFAESTINLNNIEISSGHYKFNFPELPSWIIELFRDSNTLEEGIVGHRMMDFEKFLFQINELNFSNFEFSSSSSPLEIDKENTMSQFSNNKSI